MQVTTSPWMLMPDLRPEQAQLRDENWCGVLQVLPAALAPPARF